MSRDRIKNNLYSRDHRGRMEAHLECYLEELKAEQIENALSHLCAIVRASEYDNKKLMVSLEELKPECAAMMYAEAVLYDLSQNISIHERLQKQYDFLQKHNTSISSLNTLLHEQSSALLAIGRSTTPEYERKLSMPSSATSLHRPKICLVLPAVLLPSQETWLHDFIKHTRNSFRLLVVGTPTIIEQFITSRQLETACDWVEALSLEQGIADALKRLEVLIVQSDVHILCHITRLCNPIAALVRGFFPELLHLGLEREHATRGFQVDVLIGSKEASWFCHKEFLAAPLSLSSTFDFESLPASNQQKGISLTTSAEPTRLYELLKSLQDDVPKKQQVPFLLTNEQAHRYSTLLQTEDIFVEQSTKRGSIHLILGPLTEISSILNAVGNGQEVWWYCSEDEVGEITPKDFKKNALAPCSIIKTEDELKKRVKTAKNRVYRIDKDICRALFESMKSKSAKEHKELSSAIEKSYYSYLARKGIAPAEPVEDPDPQLKKRFDHGHTDVEEEQVRQDETPVATHHQTTKPPEKVEAVHVDELLVIAETVDDYHTPFLYTMIQEINPHCGIRLICVDYQGSDVPESKVHKVGQMFTQTQTLQPDAEKALRELHEHYIFRAVLVYHPPSPSFLEQAASVFSESKIICELADKHYYKIQEVASDWQIPLRDRCDHVFVSSLRLQELHQQIQVPESSLLYKPVGVLMNVRRIASQRDTTTVISAIDFERHHAPFLILKAFEIAQKEAPSMTLELIGSGSLVDAIQQKISRGSFIEGSVSITETENHRYLLEALETADIFFNHPVPDPGTEETAPASYQMIQAMSYGISIISTSLDSIKEVFPQETDAMLINPFDSEHAAEGLVALASDEQGRQSLGNRAKKRAVESYNVEVRCAQILDLLGVHAYEDNAPTPEQAAAQIHQASAGKNLADAFKSIGSSKQRNHVPAPQQLNENVDDSLKRALGRKVSLKSKKQNGRSRIPTDKAAIDQAIALLKEGQAAKALGILHDDNRKQRVPPDFHFTRALCFIELNDLHAAKGALDKELTRNPDHHGAFKLLTEVKSEIKALEKAQQGDL